MDVGGYIGRMAVVESAMYNLLSTGRLQDRDLESKFPHDQPVCILCTRLGDYLAIPRCPSTRLCYVDLWEFIMATRSGEQRIVMNCVADRTAGSALELCTIDPIPPSRVHHTVLACKCEQIATVDVAEWNDYDKPVRDFKATPLVTHIPRGKSSRKQRPSHYVAFLVWRLYSAVSPSSDGYASHAASGTIGEIAYG